VENSPLLVGRGLARVLGDLASLGYDAKWGVLGARNAGAPHKRDRIWIVGELPDSQLLRRNSRLRGQAGQQPGERREARGVIASSGEDVADSDLCRFVEPIDDEKRREGVDSRESPGNCCGTSEDVADSHGRQSQVGWENGQMGRIWVPSVNSPSSEGRKMWATEPKLGRVANGVAHRVDRLKCIGNGQVPHCAALAWRILTEDRE
jgi:DNA (cytosine-5)-methyltransferase 1